MPGDVITAKCAPCRHQGKPWHRPALQNLDDYDIVRIYAAEYRGIVNYYLLARNVSRLATLRWNAETPMLKTLAAKHKSTVTKMAARYEAKVITGDGPRTCFEVRLQRNGKKDLVARFGGITLKRDKRARPASVGGPHGQETAQDPHRLPPLPRLHPRQPRCERGIVTGEPSALKGASWVRRRLRGKGPHPTGHGTSPRSPPCHSAERLTVKCQYGTLSRSAPSERDIASAPDPRPCSRAVRG